MASYTGDAQVLRRLAPFSWFSETQLSWALPTLEQRGYVRGSLIQRAGQEGDGLYIVQSGGVCVLHEDGEGREFLVTRLGPHDFFGELGLFAGEACAASVRADTQCDVLFIPRKIVLECLEDNPRASMCMLSKITARLCEMHRKLAHLALSTVEQRVAAALLDHGVQADGVWRVGVGSEQISTMVAASREMVSRVLKRMIEGGIVRRERRKLLVVDREAVAARARRLTPSSDPQRC